MHLKEKYFLHEDYRKYDYEESYLLGDIQIMVSHNEVLGVLIEMKGLSSNRKLFAGAGARLV